MAKSLWKGNEAVAEAALRGGCNFFAGYPITPSSETLEYLSWRMAEIGRTFIQGENEIASINMVSGASACGARALTATSGPGGALKTEGLSYAAANMIPFVLLNVQRWGTGLGALDSGQTDYFKDVKGGGNGSYHSVVLAPSSVQELVDMAYEAWDIAEKYRISVIILSEGYLGQMMEKVEMPEFKVPADRGWGIDGTGKSGLGSVDARNMKMRGEIYDKITEEMQRFEEYGTEDADYVLVAFGLPGRVCRDAVRQLREAGQKVGLIRPKVLWPFPEEAFKKVNPNVKGFISVESTDFGMLVEDVALMAKKLSFNVPVYCYAHGLGVPGVGKVKDFYNSVINGEVKERF